VTARVLIVDDDRSMCELLASGLAKRGFECTFTTDGASALDVVGREDLDAVVSDVNMRGMDGLQLSERIVANRPDLPVVVITAFGSLDTAVAALRVGAYDFLTKPFEVDTLARALDRAVADRALRVEVKRLRRALGAREHLDELVGESPQMRKLCELIAQVAPSDASVLITGESGTGKELVARALHRLRGGGPFVAINCSALPEPLLESELFGHTRGAFTDARTDREGMFVQASGGTLFLDEIGDLPMGLQPKLLRALQERWVRPVGGEVEVPFNARVVAATNRDLEAAREEKRFREDLYFRINVLHLKVPPLRDRAGDVELLAQHFAARFAAEAGKPPITLAKAAALKLCAYAWPGNVRELSNCIERAVALLRESEITLADLPEKVRGYRSSHVLIASDDPTELVPLEEVERRYILRVIDAVGGNKSQAARVLGLDRKTLYAKLDRYRGGGHAAEE
jgi:two-component system response regulator HydG